MTDHDEHNDNTHTHLVLSAGTMVQHYRIVEKIGAGGMGEVYLAEDTKLGRRVAIKFLPSHLVANDEVKTRFRREAQAVAKLNHPNIVTIHEVSEHMGRPFFVMEHIAGRSLHSFAHDDQLPSEDVVEFAIQICQGLGEAHRAGIVHRDIKAANIAVDASNRIRVLDFGLAAIQGDDKLTKTGSTLGTVAYMSPEQISGRPIDRRSDLFSFGVVLYELLAGRTPFRRDNEGATLKAIIEEAPEPLARYKSGIPEKLQEIVNKLLEKDPEFRYQTAEGVIADLKKLMYDSQSTHRSTRETKSPGAKRSLIYVLAAAVVVLAWAGYMYLKGPAVTVEPDNPVLIVLPFVNLGADADEYFSNGIHLEINTRLSAIEGLELISPSTAEKYRGTDRDFQRIGLETGANYVLEATIRWDKSGEIGRFRINPILTRTDDNYMMWSDNFDQQLTQVFEVQSEIAEQIVTALGLTLLTPNQQAPDYAPTTNMAAYNYYLRGLEISSHSFKISDFYESIMMFDSAVALDSSFTLAWAKKSINQSTFYFFFTTIDSKFHKGEALIAAEKAMALDPSQPLSKIAMGTYHNYIEQDYDRALELLYGAKSEVVSDADLSEAIGIVKMRQGEWQEALWLFEEAARIDPLNHRRYFYLANNLSMTRDYELADEYIDRALVLDPSNEDAAYMKIFVELLRNGRLDIEGGSFSQLYHDVGLAEISTYELVSATSVGLWRFVIDQINPQEALEDVRRLGKIRGTITERSLHSIHMNLAQIYDLIGQDDSAFIHYDSTRILLQNIIDQGDYEFHAVAELGLSYSFMGMKEEAIEAGKRGKEMMSVDDCHW